MPTWDIWIEGYIATGGSNTATHLGTYPGKTFTEAVEVYSAHKGVPIDYNHHGEGRHTIWACELYDNEQDARKNFG